ncbi:hypothetical protein EV383_4065 [Pseudonocardia sediminis]|uniref:Uncharacterized protein n=1 Tax=Pseudonocardia sediminis TaxID=1397368 RepID=A0A4Q7UYG7_PSEST|nr:hypothetical protein [Pseudonocardia sediminis]RZT87157.1 hypothetical protein EV383_4065 [Pseudonocardia sediminis]
MPKGYGEDDLLRAVGGGLRTAVARPDGRFAGQAKLIPIKPMDLVKGVSPIGLGLLALTIAGEMAGGDEQARTLAAIERGVDRLNTRFDMEDDARLRTAEQTIRAAHAALLDGASIPESVGLGSAMTNLQVIRNRSEALLVGWERVVAALPHGETPGVALRAALGQVGDLGWEAFPAAVRTAYHSLALDSRRIMLSAAEAQLRNPGSSLTSFRAAVEEDLAARARELDRLRTLLERLSRTPLTISTWGGGVLPHLVTDGAVENARAQALFATLHWTLTAQAPVSPTTSTITVDARPNGDLQLVRPA